MVAFLFHPLSSSLPRGERTAGGSLHFVSEIQPLFLLPPIGGGRFEDGGGKGTELDSEFRVNLTNLLEATLANKKPAVHNDQPVSLIHA